jgi:DsbC/DsbD-like thiol-disulfide interchange protein
MHRIFLILACCLFANTGASAADSLILPIPGSPGSPKASAAHPVKATLIADTNAIVPGEPFTVGLLFEIQPHWHTYWVNAGDVGTETRIKLSAPGIMFKPMQWPVPKVMAVEGGTTFGYENQVLHLIPAVAAKSLKPGQEITIKASANWLVCKKVCLKGKAELTLTLPIKNKAVAKHAKLFDTWRAQLPVPANQAPAKQMIAGIQQATGPKGIALPKFTIAWNSKAAPKNFQWLPIATEAVGIEDIKIFHKGQSTQVHFKSDIYVAEKIPNGIVAGVIVFLDPKGRRIGVWAPVRVLDPKIKATDAKSQ